MGGGIRGHGRAIDRCNRVAERLMNALRMELQQTQVAPRIQILADAFRGVFDARIERRCALDAARVEICETDGDGARLDGVGLGNLDDADGEARNGDEGGQVLHGILPLVVRRCALRPWTSVSAQVHDLACRFLGLELPLKPF